MSGIVLRLSLPRPDFSLEIDASLPARGISVVFGPSGSGKTTLLRAVAGLERPQRARVQIGEQLWQDDDRGIWLPTHRRPLGFVFQEPSLFDHLDVQANLRFGLRRSPQRAASSRALDAAIELLGIGHLLQRRAAALSGGERQRVAIARAVAAAPRLLLLDEPLASIDSARRQEILPWLERLGDELSLPMLYVTHSIDELARLADQVLVIEAGRVRWQGGAAQALGHEFGLLAAGEDPGCLIEAVVAERAEAWHLARADFPGGHLWLRDGGAALGRRLRLRVLARDVSVALDKPLMTSVQNLLPCEVMAIEPAEHPSQRLVRLGCGSAVLLALLTRRACDALALRPGCQVWAMVKAVAVVG